MIKKFSTDNFEVERMGNNMFKLKTTNMSNSILINIRDIDELINVLLKVDAEFK
jgi:hypothetical protein